MAKQTGTIVRVGKDRLATETFRRFELKDDLAPGGTADAYLLEDGEVNEEKVFEITDKRGIYRGRKKDKFVSPHDQGSRGEAEYRDGEWQIRWLTPQSLMIHGKLTADLATTDSTFTIDGVTVMNPIGGLITDQDPGDDVTVYNIFSWEGDNNGIVVAVWNQDTGRWEAIQVECPA
jgi:hypothetical protein